MTLTIRARPSRSAGPHRRAACRCTEEKAESKQAQSRRRWRWRSPVEQKSMALQITAIGTVEAYAGLRCAPRSAVS